MKHMIDDTNNLWVGLIKGITNLSVFFLSTLKAQGSSDPKNQRRRISRGCGFGPRTSTATTWPLRAPASEVLYYGLPIEQRKTNAKLLHPYSDRRLSTASSLRPPKDTTMTHKSQKYMSDMRYRYQHTLFTPHSPAASPPPQVTS